MSLSLIAMFCDRADKLIKEEAYVEALRSLSNALVCRELQPNHRATIVSIMADLRAEHPLYANQYDRSIAYMAHQMSNLK